MPRDITVSDTETNAVRSTFGTDYTQKAAIDPIARSGRTTQANCARRSDPAVQTLPFSRAAGDARRGRACGARP